ncbi:MAG: exodeoxyribonuclease V subunit gamma, partial [Endozoicomonadaceae bacterium]|nr:exodeoxyribonuclease V subunit gamma [Endozoicomonadaceae bacterium]
VHIMVHNPSQFYWGDVSSQHYHLQTQDDLQFSADFVNEEANSLLASMGKLGRDYHDLLSDIQAQEDDRFIDPITTENKTLAVPPSLLQQIQSHIFNLTEPDEAVTLPSEDDSVTINSCHSVLREVEIVHDYLLSVLEKNPDLTPKDIIVMTPDVETYSAPIQAVFSGASAQRFIPFAISDRNARREHPLLETLLNLLSCDQTRCTITDVMTILEVPAVMRRYNIQPEQLAVLHQWIAESGIRWGLDCYHKQQLGLPEQLQNTWEFGLQRLLLGYAFKGQDILYDEILPVEDIEGSDAVLSGALADFITDLTQLSRSLQKARTAEQWMLLICQVLETFFLADEKEKPVLQIVRNLLTDFCEQIENAGFKYPVAHAVMLEWLTDHLDSHKMSQRFLGGKVNVCTLMPMRSIPFKVICILGMNDGDYPRTIAPGSFDLISKFPRKGDRSRRDDDRYLFLEALLAAESYLYISYTGRNIKDNTERPPSVLLSEFLDYCQRHFNPDGQKQWVTEHPLQPFSPEYFDKRSSLFTYAAQWLVPATTTLTGETSSFIKDLSLPVLPLPEQTELEQLITFYRHPCKYFFQQRLNIHFEKLETLPKDDEPFDFTGLDNFHLQSILLDHQLRDVPSEHSIQILKASGKLPHPPFDKIKLEQIRKSLQPWVEEIKSLLTDPQEAQKVCLTVGSTRITGWIKDIYNHRLIRYHPGKVKSKLLVSGLIEHLIWCAGGKHLEETVLFYLPATAKEQSCIRLPRFSQQFSLAALEKLVHGYQRGLNEPLPFIPEVSTTWILSAKDYILQSADRGDVPQRAVQKTKEAFEREQSRDDYIARVWSEMDEKLFSGVTSIAETLLQPLIISDNKG